MQQTDYLKQRFPVLGERLQRATLASLPTPARTHTVSFAGAERSVAVKYDNLTGSVYGGNKVRKLEYIFPRAKSRHCLRVATFGSAGSNHALATALYAREAGFDCTCFLSHQARTPQVAATLNKHVETGTEIVPYGGDYPTRIRTLREHLWGRHAWVIPMGGSSWLGTVGFVAAGLELADQVASGQLELPSRIYVGAGTMGTAAGIALGVAAAGLDVEVHAVRVSETSIMNRTALDRLLAKTAEMMRRLDAAVPADLADRSRIRVRDEFFGPGYALGTPATEEAVEFGREALGLELEITYTGKALSALLADWRETGDDTRSLYWHTYNSTPLGVPHDRPLDPASLPVAFERYFAT